jgi:hypothetical protein
VPTVHLRVEPVFYGPASVGTVELIKLVRERFGLSLSDAKAIVDRCVYDGESVAISALALEIANSFARDALVLKTPAKIRVDVES